MGRKTTPLQIEKEWLEYKLIFEDLLTRWSASLAREAKAEKKRIDRLQDAGIEPPAHTKQALRSTWAQMRGFQTPNGQRELELPPEGD